MHFQWIFVGDSFRADINIISFIIGQRRRIGGSATTIRPSTRRIGGSDTATRPRPPIYIQWNGGSGSRGGGGTSGTPYSYPAWYRRRAAERGGQEKVTKLGDPGTSAGHRKATNDLSNRVQRAIGGSATAIRPRPPIYIQWNEGAGATIRGGGGTSGTPYSHIRRAG